MDITDCKKKAIKYVKWKHKKLRKDVCSHHDSKKEIAHRAGIRPETLTDYTSEKHELSKTNFWAVVFAIGKNNTDYHIPN